MTWEQARDVLAWGAALYLTVLALVNLWAMRDDRVDDDDW